VTTTTEDTPELVPSEEYHEQVKEALEHLYDLAYLQNLPLARLPATSGNRQSSGMGRVLHRELITAIETLNPGPSVPIQTPSARPYHLLIMHYVEGETVQSSALRLGISRRQAHRDLRQGIERVAQVLVTRRSDQPGDTASGTDLSAVQAEMAQLQSQPQLTNLADLLRRSTETVMRLAEQQNIRIHLDVPRETPTTSTDPVIAEQALVGILSRAVSQAHPGTITVRLTLNRNLPMLHMSYFLDEGASKAPVITPVLSQLVERLGWGSNLRDHPEGEREVTLDLARGGSTVLIIDDNKGLIGLLQRYLGEYAVRVVPAASGEEGLELAKESEPDAIVLDVMMPGMHGWEVLQRLRNHPATANTPIVICSVFNNPELACSLGASALVPKPVSRDAIVKALRELDVL